MISFTILKSSLLKPPKIELFEISNNLNEELNAKFDTICDRPFLRFCSLFILNIFSFFNFTNISANVLDFDSFNEELVIMIYYNYGKL